MNKSSRPDDARTWAAMTGWRRAVTAACSGLTLALGTPVAQAQVSVSSSGSPSYGQAIAVPPGIGGMQPNLSLMYAGGGVNGPVGHGWSVQGISMITRCPATRYTDGAPKGVVFASADKLCLDGQRLIQTDANGVPAAFPQIDDARGLATGYREYRTEKDSFARIRAYGTTGAEDTNGPLYFKVWTKAGQIYEYGATPTADANTKAAVAAQGKTVIMGWAVARVSDVVGNYIDFKYEQRDVAWGSGPTVGSPTLGREWNIAEIQYTGNSSNAQVPANKVIFRYSDRTLDKAEAYQQGSKNVSVRRLDGIDSYVNSPNNTVLGAAAGAVKVRSTNLVYDNASVTKRSRLATITECTGAATPVCQPPTRFTYANGGNEAFTASTTFNLATTGLMNNTGTMGVVPIDFDSDGKTDLLRWSDTPAQNQLWKSNGDGTFTTVPAFNITTEKLFSSDGCYESILMDYNGDGLVDILRVVKSGCANRTHILYLSSGNGAYVAQTMPAAIALDKTKITYQQPSCSALPGRVWSRTEGRYYYVADVNGDGIPDITTSIAPAWTWTCDEPPDFSTLCATLVCTRVFLGSTTGAFTEVTPSNVSNRSLYRDPALDKDVKWRNAEFDVADADGDGIADLNSSESGTWLSRPGPGGALSFDPLSGGSNLNCRRAIDANGDGRADCLNLSATVTSNALLTSTGYAAFNASAFNLNTTGNELLGTGVGTVVLDFNGDGRTDILRWKDDPTLNRLYLSNGDGSFTPSASFNLVDGTTQLSKSDGTSSFTLGDFLGNGTTQILRLKNAPTAGAATGNQLYVKSDLTLPDQLLSVVSPTGLTTTLTYASLANGPAGRYTSDRGVAGQAAAYPLVDLTIASPVVITSETEVGVGDAKVKTEFVYRGLKAAVDGRGMLGFRQSAQQNIAPNGDALSIFTDYLLDEPYAGVARRTETRKGTWDNASAQLLSWTSNTYCDRTATVSASNPAPVDPNTATDVAPCAFVGKVRRPYIRKSVEEGADLGGNPLPKVASVNTYDDYGNPTAIAVTTEGSFAGANQQYLKSTANTFCAPDTASCPNSIAGDNWILGRLSSSTVTNTVPNLLATLMPTTSPGNAANAAATSGNLQPALSLSGCTSTTPTTTPTAATMSCTLSNTGPMAAGSISYTSAPGTAVSGPTGACAANATCGVVTVTTATAAGTYSGTLTAAPNTGSSASQAISLVVNTLPALGLSGCTSTTPTISPTAATMSCTLSNTGQTGATSISYSTAASTTVSGPTGACAAGATCGTVTVTTATIAATYSGTLTATPNAGTAASQAISLVVNPPPTPPTLSLSGCTSTTPTTSPTAATMSCTLSNAGQTGASSISYSTAPGTTVSGPTGACAAGATCGTVTVTTATAAATYSGTLTATPNTGSAASQAISLVVRTPVALAFSGCTSNTPTTAPTAATMSCTLSNTGQTGATSISYATAAGTTVSGPTGACAGGATCGTVTVTTGTAAATYSGTLTATPNTGSAASQAISLVVRTPVALAFSGCTSTTPTTSPTAATMSCTLSNSGQTGASSIGYTTAASTTVSGPTGACAGGATCGTVTVTTGTAAGTYSGTLTATPNTGGAASQPLSLVVNPSLLLFTYVTQSSTSTTLNVTVTNTFRNDNATATTISARGSTSPDGTTATISGTCTVGGALAAGGTCTVVLTATKSCEGPTSIAARLSNTAGIRTGAFAFLPMRTGSSCN